MLKHLITLVLIFNSCFSIGQQINYSNDLTVSVLTCGTGNELYSQFGHSAFRVRDHRFKYDVVYNYGIFDFDQPNFYLNFAKGKLIYKLGYTGMSMFNEQYTWENRAVYEQVLNLNSDEALKLALFLQNNAKPENANYQYDFLANNCATKIPEVLSLALNTPIDYNYSHLTDSKTHRDLINDYVNFNSWSNTGINIALGSVIDRTVKPEEFNFLPDYVYLGLKDAQFKGQPLILSSKQLIKPQKTFSSPNFFTSPLFIFSIISILIIYLTLNDYKKQRRSKWLDFTILIITGFIGIFISLLWFATDHTSTIKNLNILWAFFPNFFIAFFSIANKPKKWLKTYILVLIIFMIGLWLIWAIGIQAFALSLIPLLVSLLFRYAYTYSYLKNN